MRGGERVIVFVDIIKLLKEHGYSLYRIRKEKFFGESVLARFRKGGCITTDTIDSICKLCECQPGDLMRYEPDPEEGKE